ncbi:ATP-binding protein [Geobacter argillaceus]|uniref:Histidine kinase/DNA gyrase B/HSP90-like ATPase n=1 Tax=Geobacter argillaceus TaxID=345631 RepID=A0A562VI46_9BACT|nr:ATP-binding protein [Geobacter argillaceus]TWJ17616.1 histidine kinase/DNA gyrase B/HSP90-like ATPase [Geobacter argillaceus]
MAKLRVRARAVDMLGRQQIAGIPTAIHELFKNAHDAYAERAEVDYFRRTRLLVLRDDGYGMTRDDVENRWLTLGTESRLKANRPDSVDSWTGPKNLPRRVIMGEKGIGRLAIAVIAPITLLLTRAVRPNKKMHNLVVALVHWGLFEQPGLEIGMIDVPIIELPGGTLPTRENVNELISRVRQNIEELREELDETEFSRLNGELDKAKTVAPDKIDATLRNLLKKGEVPLSLSGDGYGTHFILLPTAEELNDDIDGRKDRDPTNIDRFLLGFSNTMTGETPVIRTEFRDHHLDEVPNELIGPSNFFTHHEFNNSDHHISGIFDEYGQFNGTVRIYGESHPFVCNWPEGRGKAIACGPFSIEFSYVMGRQAESQLKAEDHKSIIDKLERIGGLYIFRNGIRILPYGNTDYDFLEIEKRRTKSAQDWFFSYRRMMGYIAISHEDNGKLHEKAGREGFRQNQAYREFRNVLINLFERLALEFFRQTAPQSDAYWEKRNELASQAELLKKQKKKADERRKEFKKLVDDFFKAYEDGEFERRAEKIKTRVERKLERLLTLEDDGALALGVRELEADTGGRLRELEDSVTITKPRGLALTARLEKDWASYQRVSADVREKIITPLRQEINSLIREATASRITDAQRREAALDLLEKQKSELVRDVSALRSDAYAAQEQLRTTLKEVVREEFSQFRETAEKLLIDFTRQTAEDPDKLDDARVTLEQELARIRESEISLLEAIKRQLIEFTEGLRERETVDDRVGALEQKAQRLEEQLEFYSDFAQMGMAVGILQHEFEKTARNMRVAVRDLKPWADGTPDLKKVYTRLRNSFDHLDGYLKLLDPLGRRLNRTKVELSGDEIRLHIRRIFRRLLEENDIELVATDTFLSRKVKCISSSILAAFVNVVDNAIYWVANGAKDEKIIRLDVDSDGFLISNSGPGIEERLRDRIFEFGESSKPGGRGMGLAISRDTLQREGFDLELLQAGSTVEPVFRIKTTQSDNEEEQ